MVDIKRNLKKSQTPSLNCSKNLKTTYGKNINKKFLPLDHNKKN